MVPYSLSWVANFGRSFFPCFAQAAEVLYELVSDPSVHGLSLSVRKSVVDPNEVTGLHALDCSHGIARESCPRLGRRLGSVLLGYLESP